MINQIKRFLITIFSLLYPTFKLFLHSISYSGFIIDVKGRVFAVCLRLLADRSQAEDACQEAFVRIWQQLPGFRGDSAFSTWLHTIASRAAVDLFRKNKVSRLTLDVEIPDLSFDQEHADPQLEQAILRLPDQARAVFVLFALEGYQHLEIAELLGIAEGTSKAQYHRARQLLRGWLDEN